MGNGVPDLKNGYTTGTPFSCLALVIISSQFFESQGGD